MSQQQPVTLGQLRISAEAAILHQIIAGGWTPEGVREMAQAVEAIARAGRN